MQSAKHMGIPSFYSRLPSQIAQVAKASSVKRSGLVTLRIPAFGDWAKARIGEVAGPEGKSHRTYGKPEVRIWPQSWICLSRIS